MANKDVNSEIIAQLRVLVTPERKSEVSFAKPLVVNCAGKMYFL